VCGDDEAIMATLQKRAGQNFWNKSQDTLEMLRPRKIIYYYTHNLGVNGSLRTLELADSLVLNVQNLSRPP